MQPAPSFVSRVGVWWASDLWPIKQVLDRAREIESLGYGSLFFSESIGKESFTQAAALLNATDQLVVGTGIANVYARDALAAEVGARTLTALHPGRFVLGLGVSHASIAQMRAAHYAKPLTMMREYLARMSEVDAGIESGGGRPIRLLAALGPRMIELAGRAADGVHPYLVTPDQTRKTRDDLTRLGGEGKKWVVSEQAAVVTSDRGAALRHGRRHIEKYLQRANYRNSLLRQGFDESDLDAGGSDRLVEALVVMGDAATVADRLQAHLDAGADHVVVQVLGADDRVDPLPACRELASVLDFAPTR